MILNCRRRTKEKEVNIKTGISTQIFTTKDQWIKTRIINSKAHEWEDNSSMYSQRNRMNTQDGKIHKEKVHHNKLSKNRRSLHKIKMHTKKMVLMMRWKISQNGYRRGKIEKFENYNNL